ncbi:TonB-dependent receptor plug domain-containing protein [Candidatus Rariloculus sp.]|uniref:TonB-dependent receptor plug domain-containing protein n=1 Tax=Candidatus Rariloculus sp. TaxID=3101265 RepID=UPI003D0B0575
MSALHRGTLFLVSATLAATFAIGTGTAVAQQDGAEPAGVLEEVTVVGSRRRDRSASESPVPVDVISGDEFLTHGDSDLDSVLAALVPSYNVAQEPISDAATLIRPATLRSLPPDATLVLVNGKRRHRAAVIALLGAGISGGSQGPDLSVIPVIALDRLEVLRDGASAQYGSDAIAGIMNFVLKEDSEGATFDAKFGSYFEGDGGSMTLAANAGFALTDAGFANLSVEWKEADPTTRSVQRGDAQDLISAGNSDVRQPAAQIWGGPEIFGDKKLFGNFGLDLGNGSEAYAFGNWAERRVEGGFYYRNPHTRGGVFRGPVLDANGKAVNLAVGGAPSQGDLDDGKPLVYEDGSRVTDRAGITATFDGPWPSKVIDANGDSVFLAVGGSPGQGDLDKGKPLVYDDESDYGVPITDTAGITRTVKVADLTGDSSGNCPIVRVVDYVADSAALASIRNDPGCYSLIEKFPGGFTPQYGGNIGDLSMTGGLRGELDSGWFYDVSASVGSSDASFYIYNTINPQLLSRRNEIPIYYHAGGYTETDRVVNFDMSKPIDAGNLWGPVNVAYGLEYRDETFRIHNGDPNSFYIDPNIEHGLAKQGFGVGSNGFAGFQPGDAGEHTVKAYGAYIDLEADVTQRLLLGGALRYEDYPDYGSTLDGKFAARLQVGDNVALRGAISTGFRVPTAGQANLRNVTTEFQAGMLADIATLPPTNPVAQQKGATALTPEESVNTTFGIVFDVGAGNVTLDYYNIEIEDRVSFTSRFTLTEDDISALLAAGVSDATSFSSVRFFSNQQTVEASGVDLVASWPFQLGSGASTVTVVANWSDIELTRFDPDFTSKNRLLQIEQGRPDSRITATWSHAQDRWRVMGRVRYYGEFYDAPTNDGSVAFYPAASTLFDFEAAFDVNDSMTLLLGLQNGFDEYPTVNTNPSAMNSYGNVEVAGLAYPEQSPFGFNGGYYYLRATWRL